jgi:hypothetical protein
MSIEILTFLIKKSKRLRIIEKRFTKIKNVVKNIKDLYVFLPFDLTKDLMVTGERFMDDLY